MPNTEGPFRPLLQANSLLYLPSHVQQPLRPASHSGDALVPWAEKQNQESKSEMEKRGIQTAQPRLLEDEIRGVKTDSVFSATDLGMDPRAIAVAHLLRPCHLIAWVSVPGMMVSGLQA